MHKEMSDRKRNLEALLFGSPDRIPLSPGSGRKATRERWHREGLPETILPGGIPEYAYRQAGEHCHGPRGERASGLSNG